LVGWHERLSRNPRGNFTQSRHNPSSSLFTRCVAFLLLHLLIFDSFARAHPPTPSVPGNGKSLQPQKLQPLSVFQSKVPGKAASVQRLYYEVQLMDEIEDFEKVLSLLAYELKRAGLVFDTSSIEVLETPLDKPTMAYFEENGFRYTTYTIDPEGKVNAESDHIQAPFPPVNKETIERYIAGEAYQALIGGTHAILEVPIAGNGRLSLTSSQRKEYNEEEIETLKNFADAVALGYQRFLDLKEKMGILEKELLVVRDMQMALLPKESPDIEGLELSGVSLPASQVGSDYFNYVFIGKDPSKLGIVVADVSGHGMESAAVAMRFNEILRYEARDNLDGMSLLKGLDNSLKGNIPDGMTVTAGVAIWDTKDKSLNFSSAGNPEVYHYSSESGKVNPLEVHGFFLGMGLLDLSPPSSKKIEMASGDFLVFTSNGVEEAGIYTGENYGTERLVHLIDHLGKQGVSSVVLRDAIIQDVLEFMADRPQEDDITVVVLKRTHDEEAALDRPEREEALGRAA